MSLDKLGRKLRREAVANPKKAALLGLVTILAMYFWAPLLRGWFFSDKAGAQAAIEVTPAAGAVGVQTPIATPTATDKPATAQSAVTQPAWQQVAEWMQKDPRTVTAPALVQARDPFQTPTADEPEMTAEDKLKAKPPVIAPTAAGLVMTSTIIGPDRRAVQINGKPYREGDIVEVAKDKSSLPIKYKLIEVHSRRVILEAEGERFELSIPETKQSDKIQFLGSVIGR